MRDARKADRDSEDAGMTVIELSELHALPQDTKVLIQTRHKQGWRSLMIVTVRRICAHPGLLRHVERDTRALVLAPGGGSGRALDALH
jgi:hypothetical protein